MKRTMMILALLAGSALPALAEDILVEDPTQAPMSTPDTSEATKTDRTTTGAVMAKDRDECTHRKKTLNMM